MLVFWKVLRYYANCILASLSRDSKCLWCQSCALWLNLWLNRRVFKRGKQSNPLYMEGSTGKSSMWIFQTTMLTPESRQPTLLPWLLHSYPATILISNHMRHYSKDTYSPSNLYHVWRISHPWSHGPIVPWPVFSAGRCSAGLAEEDFFLHGLHVSRGHNAS